LKNVVEGTETEEKKGYREKKSAGEACLCVKGLGDKLGKGGKRGRAGVGEEGKSELRKNLGNGEEQKTCIRANIMEAAIEGGL